MIVNVSSNDVIPSLTLTTAINPSEATLTHPKLRKSILTDGVSVSLDLRKILK
jgi:hypothetical protein